MSNTGQHLTAGLLLFCKINTGNENLLSKQIIFVRSCKFKWKANQDQQTGKAGSVVNSRTQNAFILFCSPTSYVLWNYVSSSTRSLSRFNIELRSPRCFSEQHSTVKRIPSAAFHCSVSCKTFIICCIDCVTVSVSFWKPTWTRNVLMNERQSWCSTRSCTSLEYS